MRPQRLASKSSALVHVLTDAQLQGANRFIDTDGPILGSYQAAKCLAESLGSEQRISFCRVRLAGFESTGVPCVLYLSYDTHGVLTDHLRTPDGLTAGLRKFLFAVDVHGPPKWYEMI
jgi:hypothetical protein